MYTSIYTSVYMYIYVYIYACNDTGGIITFKEELQQYASCPINMHTLFFFCSCFISSFMSSCIYLYSGMIDPLPVYLGNFYYRKTSSISRTKFQNLNVSCILLQLSSLNSLKPGVKLRMKM